MVPPLGQLEAASRRQRRVEKGRVVVFWSRNALQDANDAADEPDVPPLTGQDVQKRC